MLIEETQAQGKQLPEEIIEDILKRLPVQSLVRFSCTCKQWRSLIFSDPKFNKAHITHAKRPSWKIPEIRFRIQFKRTIDCDCNIATLRKETLTSYLRCRPICLIGSCNGLLFFVGYSISDGSKQHLLWNPYTNSIKRIDGQIEGSIYYAMSGLSYDRASDDYKAIVVVSNFFSAKRSVYLFSLRRNLWKKLPDLTGRYWVSDECGITLDNGICHWQVGSKRHRGSRIIWFDPVVEKFKDVPLPDKLPSSHGWFGIGALDGCLSLVHRNRVWVMKEYGCWTKLHALWLPEISRPIGYNSSKDKVLVAYNGGVHSFRIADVENNKCGTRSPSEDQVGSINEAYCVVSYTESLLCPWLCL